MDLSDFVIPFAVICLTGAGFLAYREPRLYIAMLRPGAAVGALLLVGGATWQFAVGYTTLVIIKATKASTQAIPNAARAAEIPTWVHWLFAALVLAFFLLSQVAKYRAEQQRIEQDGDRRS